FLEALRLIEANGDEEGNLMPEDLMLWAIISAARPDSLSRQRALVKLEEAKRKRPLSPQEQLILARLYEGADRWYETREIMTSLLAHHAKNPEIVEPWCRWLIERNELEA